MNPIVATRVAILGVRTVYALKTHRTQMKKLRAQRQLMEDMHERLKEANTKPQPIYVVCERLA